jgi:hypothetical protein
LNVFNAAAVFGDYRMDGDPSYILLYYPLNMAEDLRGKIHGDPRMHRTQRLDMDAHLGMIRVGRHPIGKPPLSADTSPMRDQIAMLLVLFETQPRLPSPHSRPSRFPRKCAPVNSSPQ